MSQAVKDLQKVLNNLGVNPKLDEDGDLGNLTKSGIDSLPIQSWIKIGMKSIGTREVKGTLNNLRIVQWAKLAYQKWITNDEIPWCATAVSGILEESGVKSARTARAKDYLKYGIKLSKPMFGCIVIFGREGGGHVGFLIGIAKNGNLIVIGGNQSDEFNIKAFSPKRVLGYVYPPDSELSIMALKDCLSTAQISIKEA